MASSDTKRERKLVRLPRNLRERALEDAAELLAQRRSTTRTVDELVERYGVSPRTALRLLDEVYARWQLEAATRRPLRQELQRRSLEQLYRTALVQQQFGVCLQIERLLMRIDGTAAMDSKPPASLPGSACTRCSAVESRSDDELRYYIETGRWPTGQGKGSPTPIADRAP